MKLYMSARAKFLFQVIVINNFSDFKILCMVEALGVKVHSFFGNT